MYSSARSGIHHRTIAYLREASALLVLLSRAMREPLKAGRVTSTDSHAFSFNQQPESGESTGHDGLIMKLTTKPLSIFRTILFNMKWIMVGILCLNLFCFGYFDKLYTPYSQGMDTESWFWGIIIIAITILLFACDKGWKKLCLKICDFIRQRQEN